ncbi:FlgD immunoglobulin-like domain containing protein [bacterium]
MNQKQKLIHCRFLIIFVFIVISSIAFAGTIHSAHGVVQYSGGGYPSSLSFSAYIASRPGEVLTQSSSGCTYYAPTGSWLVQCATFPTAWTAGDVLHIDFNDGAGGTGSDNVTLTNGSADNAGTTTLSQPSKQITVTTSPSGRSLIVDGSGYTAPHTFTWSQGTSHTISVASPQSGGTGTQYVYASWSDGGAQSHTYVVPGSNETVTATFNTQYYLTVSSGYGSPTGQGWYNAGASASFGVTTPVSGGTGTRYIFANWTGSGSGSYSGTVVSSSVTMNNPITETASWTTQYYLTTAESPGIGGTISPAPPGGWYNNGSVVSANATEAGGYQWTGWSGALSGTTRPQDVTMNSPKSVTANFVKEIDVTINTSPTGRSFTVDGTPYSSGQTFTWLEGSSHSLAVTSPQSGGTGTRYQYLSWSDGGGQSHSYTVPGSNQTVTANFQTEYELTINSTHGSPTGADWYTAGSSATFGVTSPESGGAGTRYVFTGWTGGGSGSYTGTSASYTVTMNNPITETASWKTQYQLTVNSTYGSPSGAGWYDAGTSATFGVTTPTSGGTGTQYILINWTGSGTGSYSGTSASYTVTMNNSIIETASWNTQYYLTTTENPPAGGSISPATPGAWYNSGTVVPVNATEAGGYQWAGWSGALSGTTRPQNITMNSVKSVTANFGKEVQITVNTSPSGRSFTVDGTTYTSSQTFTWIENSSHTLSVTSPQSGATGIRYLYSSWNDGGGQSHSYTVPGSNQTVTANFQTQYELIINSTHGSPSGAGWYTAGASATFGVTSPESGGTGTQYVFSSWTGSGSGSYTGTNASHTVTMNNPITETASWKTQYQLTVNSSYGSPTGAGWYDSGTSATFNVSSPESGGSGTRYMFTGWTGVGLGSYTGSSASYTVTMNNPITETASWNTQCYLTTTENPPAGGNISPATPGNWYNSGTVVSVDATTAGGYQWAGWSGALSGTTRPQDITINGPKSVTANFGKEVEITVNANPSGQSFSVDGTTYTSVQTFTWIENETHSLSVVSPQSSGPGRRYIFSSWSDGGAQSHSYLVPGSNGSVIATLQLQYYFTVNSDHGSPQGAGWYAAGSTANFSVTSPDASGSTRHIFSSWSGDHTGTSPSASILMTEPKTVNAAWYTQYYLNLVTNYGSPQGAGWYAAGSTANFSVSSPDARGSTRFVFVRYSGDYNGTNTAGSIVMNDGKNINVEWRTEFYLYMHKNPNAGGEVNPIPPGKWCRAWDDVTLSATPNSAQNYVFSGWTGDVSGTENPVTIKMDRSKRVTANFNYAGQIRITTEPEGLIVVIDNSEYTAPQDFMWPSGSTHSIGAPSPQSGGEKTQYQYSFWSDGGAQTHDITINGVSLFTANYETYFYLDMVIDPANSGSVTPPPPGAWIKQDSSLVIEAVPDTSAGYIFSGWFGDHESQLNPDEIVMDTPKELEARFNLGTHQLSVDIIPPEKGSVQFIPEKETYTHGENVTLIAVPLEGNLFSFWSGDVQATSDTLEIVMDEDCHLEAHFAVDDKFPPILKDCYPPDGAKQVPVNSRIQFKLEDQHDGAGIDENSLYLSINNTPVLVDGQDQTGGQISIQQNSQTYIVTYIPQSPFKENALVDVMVQCIDLAYPSNLLYKKYSFETGSIKVTEKAGLVIGPEGGAFTCDSTDVEIVVPEGAVKIPTEIILSLCDNLPVNPDGGTCLGIMLHVWPEGLEFADTVVIGIPYTEEDLQEAGISNPMQLGVYYFSARKGEWIQLMPFDADESHIFVHIIELCYFSLSDMHVISDVQEEQQHPSEFAMFQNYPNPFNPSTMIEYVIPEHDQVSLVIYNMQGQRVKTLVHEEQTPGIYQVIWYGENEYGAGVSNGLYMFVLRYKNQRKIVKALFMK